jgi:hypothetical protein
MEWIKAILPLIGVAIGWLLSESGKALSDKRQDKRKLKKLLFFLLELRFHFSRELSTELYLDKYFNILKNKMVNKFGIDKNDSEFNLGLNSLKPILEQLISKNNVLDDKFEYLEENIDKILIDLAEIFPILAYELNGQHKIKERLNKANNYFSEIQSLTEELPFDLKQWINPKLTKDLLVDLDESIKRIAIQIDKQTLKDSNEKIAKMVFDNDDDDINKLIDEYLEKIIENISK